MSEKATAKLDGNFPVLPTADTRISPYNRIRDAILAGQFAPGQQLVETALARWCEVSRTPVREALSRLEQDGLVVRGNRGLVVKVSPPEEILDVYDVRIVLEAKAAQSAAARRTEYDLSSMRRFTEEMRSLSTDDPQELVARNTRFHASVWHASHNEYLIDLLERLSLHLGRYTATTLAYPGRKEQSDHEHESLIEAIAAGDQDGAAKIARDHFSESRDIRLQLWHKE